MQTTRCLQKNAPNLGANEPFLWKAETEHVSIAGTMTRKTRGQAKPIKKMQSSMHCLGPLLTHWKHSRDSRIDNNAEEHPAVCQHTGDEPVSDQTHTTTPDNDDKEFGQEPDEKVSEIISLTKKWLTGKNLGCRELLWCWRPFWHIVHHVQGRKPCGCPWHLSSDTGFRGISKWSSSYGCLRYLEIDRLLFYMNTGNICHSNNSHILGSKIINPPKLATEHAFGAARMLVAKRRQSHPLTQTQSTVTMLGWSDTLAKAN